MTRMLRTALSVIGAAIACAVLAPCSALAGSYVVHACSPESSPGPWAQVNPAPAGFASGNLCGGPEIGPLDVTKQGSLWAEDILSSPANIPDGARAGWLITAPPGAIITEITYYRTLSAYINTDLAAGLFLDSSAALEQCRIGTAFGSPINCSMLNDQVPRAFGGLSTSSLFFGVLCDIVSQGVTACTGGGTLHEVRAFMYSARVTISENSPPTIGNVGGGLWGGGVASGTVPVTFSATDASGIRDQAVQTSLGQPLVSHVLGCDFGLQPPCPQSPNATLSVDTTRVPDGAQTFRLVVSDAAGNSRVVTSPSVTIDNFGPPPPVGLTATAQPGLSAIALTWTNPAAPPQPVISAMAQLCSTTCSAAVTVNAFGSAQLTAPGPGVYSARVWLLDTAGRGGPHNAAATVVTLPSTSPPPPPPPPPRTRISALLHGRQLRVSGPITASGRVTVSWRSKIGRRTAGHGSRAVTIRNHRLRVTFAIPRHARTAAATIRVAVRSVRRVIVGQAKARRTWAARRPASTRRR